MIIFSPFMPQGPMIDLLALKHKISQIHTLNFNSARSDIPSVFNLSPPGNLQSLYGYQDDAQLDEQTRDALYCRYISEYGPSFVELMRFICMLYERNDVCIWFVVMHSEYRDDYVNCFMKFLQQRYGLISNEVTEPGDMDNLQQAVFSLMGLANFQLDRERYLTMTGMAERALYDDGLQ